jgi:CBS domain-containing protein
MARALPGELSLFQHRVRDLVAGPPVRCAPEASAVDVARTMLRSGVGAVLVAPAEGAPIGIITDRDLRRKVVAAGREAASTRAAEIMSAPLITIPAAAFAFEALLEMTRREIHHLAVDDESRLIGVVSSHDFLRLQLTHPVTLAREIGRAVSLEALATHARRVTGLVRQLLDEGGTAYDIAQIVAELNDRIVVRALGLTAGRLEEAGEDAPPLPYCWLAFGSEARREQTLRTDQDNGLVYADPPPELAQRAAEYYGRFAADAIRALVSVGFPPCPGDFMASNPRWCQPASTWADYFRRWMGEPRPEQVLAACIFFDLRPLAGAVELGEGLRRLLQHEAPGQRAFLGLLARDVASQRVPLTWLGNVAVTRRGPHRGRVDIKAGAQPVVGAARLDALVLGLATTNTIDRLREAGARGVYRDDEVREITDAYQHLVRLRLIHQLEQVAHGEQIDNAVDPRRLSHANALLFRDALKTISRVQAGIRDRYATDFIRD